MEFNSNWSRCYHWRWNLCSYRNRSLLPCRSCTCHSFIIAGIACVFAALCYAEFASIIPVEGSAYAYAYGTVGEIFAWAMGWCLILEYAMASMAVSVSWSGYFNKFLKIFNIHLAGLSYIRSVKLYR
jgi:amino acid permease